MAQCQLPGKIGQAAEYLNEQFYRSSADHRFRLRDCRQCRLKEASKRKIVEPDDRYVCRATQAGLAEGADRPERHLIVEAEQGSDVLREQFARLIESGTRRIVADPNPDAVLHAVPSCSLHRSRKTIAADRAD